GVGDGVEILRTGVPGGSHASVAPHRDDIPDEEREGPVDVLVLRDVADLPRATRLCRREPGEAHASVLGADDPHDGLEEGRLARAVHADEPAYPPALDAQARPVEGRHPAVAHRDVRDVDRGSGHRAPPVSPVTMTSASWRMRSR